MAAILLILICHCLKGFLTQNILVMEILGVTPRKHQYYFFLKTTCPKSLQSDKYEYCLIDLYLSLILNLRLKLIYCENSRVIPEQRVSIIIVYIWQSSSSNNFARGKEHKQLQESHRKASVLGSLF